MAWVWVVRLDLVDKRLLFELGSNCRQSYQILARKLGLTVNAIKKRIAKLLESGVIVRFTVQLVGSRYGILGLHIHLFTDGKEDKETFIQQLGDTPLIHEVESHTDGHYAIGGSVLRPEEVLNLDRILRKMEHVTKVEMLQPIMVWPTKLQFPLFRAVQGGSTTFSKLQKQVLRCLVEETRMPITEIAQRTKLTPKRVRRVLQELEAEGNVRFYIRYILGAGTDFDCDLKIRYDPSKGEPIEIVDWFHERYSLEFWWAIRYVDEPVLFIKLLVSDLHLVEEMSELVKQFPMVQSVETLIYHALRLFPRLSELRLRQMLDLPDK